MVSSTGFQRLRTIFKVRNIVDRETLLENISKDETFAGAKIWMLIAAILLASVGLNVNSAAVIIGAMLVSPLMGPIVGGGVSIALWHVPLLIRSIRQLGIMMAVSILISAIYFLISPLGEPQSELVARTEPTLFDVLVAVGGGLAGAICLVRGDKSTTVAGVAIATALMPPLCTVAYSLVHLQWQFALGAFYLFFINGVFIAVVTAVVIRVLGYHAVQNPDAVAARRLRWIGAAILIVTLIPSVIFAIRISGRSFFEGKVRWLTAALERTFPECSAMILSTHYGADTSQVRILLVGKRLDSTDHHRVDSLQRASGLVHTSIVVRDAGGVLPEDISQSMADKLFAINSRLTSTLHEKTRIIERSIWSIASTSQLQQEAIAAFPKLDSISFSVSLGDSGIVRERIVTAHWKSNNALIRIAFANWIHTRTLDSTIVIH